VHRLPRRASRHGHPVAPASWCQAGEVDFGCQADTSLASPSGGRRGRAGHPEVRPSSGSRRRDLLGSRRFTGSAPRLTELVSVEIEGTGLQLGSAGRGLGTRVGGPIARARETLQPPRPSDPRPSLRPTGSRRTPFVSEGVFHRPEYRIRELPCQGKGREFEPRLPLADLACGRPRTRGHDASTASPGDRT
jgi:hypothetical protein